MYGMEKEKSHGGSFQAVIDIDKLPVYQEATEGTDITIEILANPGEDYTSTASGYSYTYKLSDKKVAIRALSPTDDFRTFWKQLKESL